ncbi:ABC transporter ATP-binding protein [Parablautia intestinalis]|jgi:ABC-type multidrug transport system fused ATPase/permease subunit|uniref:ABC transporter ATP-binding protein n=1 Tax=Parablautia intestinalis TaxID=2320100 RepID=A0A3A9AK22_9FIRM|nr:ABC transporter ATP-binding protein [Parablautia intestinalis]MCI8614765.1 ABC transporter ATP-binding protein [Lachnospiraceae bacterium]RKI91727.1 ABC transporter ATP-binding protein [Parablautia intestinalis]
MKKIVRKLMVLLDKRQKRIMILLILLMLVGAVLETAGVSMVVPAMQVVMDAHAVEKYRYLQVICDISHLGYDDTRELMMVTMLALVVIFAIKNIFLFFQQKAQLKFVYTNQFATSRRMMINFMERPYEYYLNADTSVIQRSITSDVNNMYGLILSLLQLTSEVIVFVCLLVVSFKADVWMTVTVAVLLVAVLMIIKGILKPIMKKAGEENQEYYSGLYKWIDQSVMGIKEIKIANKENYFINEYAKCGAGYVNAVQRYNLYNATPRLLIETVAIAGMIFYMMFQLLRGTPVSDILPQVTALGVAAMRLIPCANRINNHLTAISYFEPFFMGVSDNLQEEIRDESINYDERIYQKQAEIKKLEIKDKIELKDIVYKYPNTDIYIFDHADMEIPIGKAVGIVGTSGAGKTTVVDIMLGLLRLQSGQILADGVEVRRHYHSWLKNIGYIPQTIFMIDASIRRNVAFGYGDDEIDDEKVWYALREAQLDEFVRGLPEGLDTSIGERGIRISGGQRQRIGIARALLEDPEVLVLDEATSALDNETEAAIMDSINRLHGRKTLVIIAHRLQTIEKCDMVYRVEKGKMCRER